MADEVGHLSRSGLCVARSQPRRGFLRGALAACALWAGGGGLCAQPAPGVQTVRFAVFSPKLIDDAAFVPRPGAASQKLAFQPTARSVRYEYRGAMPLRFVDETGVVVAEAQIPPALREALLLFTSVEKPERGQMRYRVAVLDDSAARQGPGTLAIVNLSGLALAGTLDDRTLAIGAGLNAPVTIGGAAKLELRTTFKGRSYRSYAGAVQLGRNQRALLVLFPPFYSGSQEVQSRLLVDYPPGSEPPPPKAPARR